MLITGVTFHLDAMSTQISDKSILHILS